MRVNLYINIFCIFVTGFILHTVFSTKAFAGCVYPTGKPSSNYIDASAGLHGSIFPSCEPGSGKKIYQIPNHMRIFKITPDIGYRVDTVTINGVKKEPGLPVYFIYTNNFDQTITATFASIAQTREIIATADAHGSISPSGRVPVTLNDSAIFTITPDPGYKIKCLIINGKNYCNNPSSIFKFDHISQSQTIQATFFDDPNKYISNFYNDALNHNFLVNANLFNLAVSKIADLNSISTVLINNFKSLTINKLYELTNQAITQYKNFPSATNVQIAVNDINLLKPFTQSQVNGVTYYDDSIDQLTKAVDSVISYSNKNKVYRATDPNFMTDNSFAYTVALDSVSNIYVSTPSLPLTGKGVIYEIQHNPSKVMMIKPIAPQIGDEFGRLFAISGNTLIASSEPADGHARLYEFTLQNNQWVQQNIIDLTNFSNIKIIHYFTLAFSGNTIVVGLREYGKYMVLDKNPAPNSTWQLDLMGSVTTNNTFSLLPLAATGDFIAIGAPSVSNNSFVRILQKTAGDAQHIFNWQATDIKRNYPQFGFSLGISLSLQGSVSQGQKSVYTIAIGSPYENNSNGAVYTMSASFNKIRKQYMWSSLMPLNLFETSDNLYGGWGINMSGNMLMVSNGYDDHVMVYKLNNINQWSWVYTSYLSATWLTFFSLATDGTTAVIGQQHEDYVNCNYQTTQGCVASLVQVVQP